MYPESKNEQKVARQYMSENEIENGQEAQVHAQILQTLGALGGKLTTDDALVFQGRKMILPEAYQGRVQDAVRYLRNYIEQQEHRHDFNRSFKYRPFDVAHAFQAALKKVWGTTGLGVTKMTFFGPVPPRFVTVDTSHNTQAQVPWGTVAIPALEAECNVTQTRDAELGVIGHISIEAPRKYRAQIDGLFMAIENELETNSIYRGKAIDGAATPGFFNPNSTDPTKVIYSDEVVTQLSANIWSLIEHTEETKALGLPLKRTALLYGPFGTGKTLAATLTAQKAIANGWTFVQCRAGQDDLQETLRTARLYEPAVVFFEDIDKIAENGDPNAVSVLLDIFDGMTAKGAQIMVVLTTNHIERIQKGMLRPGRLDALIEIGALDRQGFERLIKATVPSRLLGDVDYDAVAVAFDKFLPAFAKEAIDRAVRYQLDRTGGKPGKLETHDFVEAANGLRPQLRQMEAADEGKLRPTLDLAVKDVISEVVHGAKFMDSDGDARFELDASDEAKLKELY